MEIKIKKEDVLISVVSPVYNAHEIVDELIIQLESVLSNLTINYEIILIDDGSIDKSWSKIEKQCKVNDKIVGIKLSRNFGQHHAITAGLNHISGENVVVMDCDLQDNPIYIDDMMKKSEEGYDIVFTEKNKKEHGLIKNFLSYIYYNLFNVLKNNKDISINSKIGSYCLIKRNVVNKYCNLNEYHISFTAMLKWLGFSSTSIIINHDKRFKGKTSYNLKKSVDLALNTILSHSDKLLKISILTGLFFILIGIISSSYIIYNSITYGFLPGWPSMMVLLIGCTGLILFSLGILSLYVGKIFMEVKKRPQYVIEKSKNL